MVKETDSWLECQEFEHRTIEDPACIGRRGSNVLRLVWNILLPEFLFDFNLRRTVQQHKGYEPHNFLATVEDDN
ncbi:hypothetical protein TNCV_3632501 [Trichonephila clavipes]|nr:hypothetical protein TNCV_3632501 [Trichonephila clavipes]